MSHDGLPDSPFRRILFCTDFSDNANRAFEYALDAARRRPGSTLQLLHVIPEPEAQFWKTYIYEIDGVDEKAKRDVDEKIAEAYLSRVPDGVDVQVHVRIGRDYLEILKFAEENDVDLIVVGRHGRSAFGHFLFGSVTEKIARKADCPVLIVPVEAGSRGVRPGE